MDRRNCGTAARTGRISTDRRQGVRPDITPCIAAIAFIAGCLLGATIALAVMS